MSNDFLHKVKGNRGENAAAYSRGKAALRALESDGGEYQTKTGAGYKAKRGGEFREIELHPQKDSFQSIQYYFLTNSVHRINKIVDSHGPAYPSSPNNNLAYTWEQLQQKQVSQHMGGSGTIYKMSGNKPCDSISVTFPEWKQDARFLGGEAELYEDYYNSHNLNWLYLKEQRFIDEPSCIHSTTHVGGGFVVFGVIASRVVFVDDVELPPTGGISGRYQRTGVTNRYVVQHRSINYNYDPGSTQVLEYHRPISGAFFISKGKPKKPLVWEEAILPNEPKKADFLFGHKLISKRFGSSPFFEHVVSVGAKDGSKSKGYVFATNSWEVNSHINDHLAGFQPSMASSTQELSVYIGRTSPFSWAQKNLGAYSKYDASPVFVGQPGCLMVLTGVDFETSHSFTDSELYTESRTDFSGRGTHTITVFEVSGSSSVIQNSVPKWVVSYDYGETWGEVAEPVLSQAFGVKNILSAYRGIYHEFSSSPHYLIRVDNTEFGVPGIQGKYFQGEGAVDTIKQELPGIIDKSLDVGKLREYLSITTASIHVEYIGKNNDGEHIMAAIIPFCPTETITSSNMLGATGEPASGYHLTRNSSYSGLFIGPLGSMREVNWSAKNWVFGQNFDVNTWRYSFHLPVQVPRISASYGQPGYYLREDDNPYPFRHTSLNYSGLTGAPVVASLYSILTPFFNDAFRHYYHRVEKLNIGTTFAKSHPEWFGGFYNNYATDNTIDRYVHTFNQYSVASMYSCFGYNYVGPSAFVGLVTDRDSPSTYIKNNIYGTYIKGQPQKMCIGNGSMAVPVKHGADLTRDYLMITTDFGASWRLEEVPGTLRTSRSPTPFSVITPRKKNKPAKLAFFVSNKEENKSYILEADDEFRTTKKKSEGSAVDNLPYTVGGFVASAQEGTALQSIISYNGTPPCVNPAFPGLYDGK